MARRCGQINELVLLALACLAPWALGAVMAWAELVLYLGIALSALLGAVSGRGTGRSRSLACAPSLALVGLVLLAMAQSAAWPGRMVGRIAPASAAFLASLGPDRPGRILDDPGPPPAPPGPAISQYPEMTVDVATRLAAGWVLLQSVLGAGLGPGAFRRLGVALAVNAALLALFAVVQALAWNGRMFWVLSRLETTARGGPFVNRNHLAAYLNLGLGFPLAILLASRTEASPTGDRGRRLSAAYAAGLIVVGVLASLSRGGFVAMVVATAVLLVVARPRSLRVVGGLAAALGLAAAFLGGVGASGPLRRIATLSEPGAIDARLECWRGALRAWSSCPVQGLGLGSFAASSARFFDRDRPVVFMHAENEYLEVLAEGGMIGLALVALLLASVLRMGFRAGSTALDPRRRVPILGALFGVVALATHCLGDFPMHIPAIAVPAVILAAHLVRAGLEARGPRPSTARPSTARVGAAMAALVPVALGLLAVRHGVEMARSEAALVGSGIPPAGADVPTSVLWDAPIPTLERARGRLVEALRHRPNWAEGHARLGLVCLSQYRAAVAGLVGDRAGDPGRAEAVADPLWLHGVVHAIPPGRPASAGGVLGHEAIRRHLVPAARSFLEARRCCPVWGLPHAELASLDYLIPGGDSTSDHARRALSLAGADVPTIATAARAAAQAGDLRSAALGWRQMIRVRGDRWEAVADRARAVLTPRQVLDWVLPDGRSALRFADRLYSAPEDRPARDLLLGWAVERLPHDLGLPEAERLRFEAQAQARLGRAGLARERMLAALALEPHRSEWRRELVGWLLDGGRLDEAHDQALIGLHLAPTDPDAHRAVDLAAEALSRGSPRPPAPARR